MTPIKTYFPNGQIEVDGFLADDVQVGNWTFYHENGNIFTTGQFDNKGTTFGIWTEYYENGQKKYEAISERGNWYSLSDDNLQILNYWTEEGDCLIRDGQGFMKTYFDNGKIKHTSVWKNNLKNGILQEFYDNGKINIEWKYINGMRDGEGKIFHDNGNLYIQCFYAKGKEVGQYKEWYEDGKICEVGFYENEKYIIDDFWDEAGEQRLFNGTGYVIKREGSGGLNIYKQDFENYKMTKETRL